MRNPVHVYLICRQLQGGAVHVLWVCPLPGGEGVRDIFASDLAEARSRITGAVAKLHGGLVEIEFVERAPCGRR